MRYSKDEDAARISVAVSEDQPAESDRENQPSKKYWRILITDEGRGIPEDLKPKIFERYLSGASGSGLGLSIVHALIVDRYKGILKIKDSVPGDSSKGTAVEIFLPGA